MGERGHPHVCVSRGPGATHALADIVLATQQRLQLSPQRAVLPLKLFARLLLLLQGPGQRQCPGLALSALGLRPLPLLHCPQDRCLLLRQELPG